ncbi:MAG: hypothetical protein MJ098_06935, partial [Saccharofermentans sp.]|nr:hypothetical protein [Saccharofermentans sp.]
VVCCGRLNFKDLMLLFQLFNSQAFREEPLFEVLFARFNKKPPQGCIAAVGGKVHSGYSGDRKTLL